MVGWLHRRSEEPSPTEQKCYWKKSVLSSVGSTLKHISVENIAGPLMKKIKQETTVDVQANFLNDVISTLTESDCMLLNQINPTVHPLSVHKIISSLKTNAFKTQNDFKSLLVRELKNHDLSEVCSNTSEQFKSELWCELRYARITASKLYETAQCHTAYGALTKKILGAKTFNDNKYMKRGRDLEPLVVEAVQAHLKVKIHKCGLVLHEKYPLFGSSPDGISNEFVLEVKSPYTAISMKNYFDDKGPKLKYRLQILLQILMSDKQYGIFCVAKEDFETSKKIKIMKVARDDALVLQYMSKAESFWMTNIFPKLLKN
jgi:hypothetical protein